MMRIVYLVAALALLAVGCKSGDAPAPKGGDTVEKPADKAGDQAGDKVADKAGEAKDGDSVAAVDTAGEVQPAGDKPGEAGCGDCLVRVCNASGQLAGLRLDTSKLNDHGATLTGGALTLDLADKGSVSVPVAGGELQKTSSLKDPLKGLPEPTDKAWGAVQANLDVEYKTAAGSTGTVRMPVGKIEVGDCP